MGTTSESATGNTNRLGPWRSREVTQAEQAERDFLRFMIAEQYRLRTLLDAITKTITVYEAQRAPETAQPVETDQTPVPTSGAQTTGRPETTPLVEPEAAGVAPLTPAAMVRTAFVQPRRDTSPKPKSGPVVILAAPAPVAAVASTIAAASGTPVRTTYETIMNWAGQRGITLFDLPRINAKRRTFMLPPFELASGR